MTNTTINDMIETIEHYAQTQPDFPVYNVLGEVHTYADLKADSDSLAAKIDSLGWPRVRDACDLCSLDQVRSCLYSN